MGRLERLETGATSGARRATGSGSSSSHCRELFERFMAVRELPEQLMAGMGRGVARLGRLPLENSVVASKMEQGREVDCLHDGVRGEAADAEA